MKVLNQNSSNVVSVKTVGSSTVGVTVVSNNKIASSSESSSGLISIKTNQGSQLNVDVLTNQATVYVPTGGDGEIYSGSYVVRPSSTSDTVLETKGKTLTDDVTVRKVRRYEVTNDTGGKTVYIGWES